MINSMKGKSEEENIYRGNLWYFTKRKEFPHAFSSQLEEFSSSATSHLPKCCSNSCDAPQNFSVPSTLKSHTLPSAPTAQSPISASKQLFHGGGSTPVRRKEREIGITLKSARYSTSNLIHAYLRILIKYPTVILKIF